MASATWLALLKLDLASVVSAKGAPHKPRRRHHRPRLAAEQLEDRTLPSGGMPLLGPAAHHPPAPPPHGPAAQGPPSPPNNGQEQNNHPQAPAGNGQGNGNDHDKGADNGPGQNNPPPGLAANKPGNGNGHDKSADNGPSPNNPPPVAAGNGQGNGNGQSEDAGNGPGQNNPPPGLAANGRGNGHDHGEGTDNGPGGENSPPPSSGPGAGNQPQGPPTPADNGLGNDNGQGIENGSGAPLRSFGSPSALGSSGFGAIPAEVVGEPSALGAIDETLSAVESSALGEFAKEAGSAEASPAAPSNGSSSGPEEMNAAMPGYNAGSASPGTPLLIASSPTASGAFVPLVLGLSTPSAEDSLKTPSNYPPSDDLDRLFLDLWDDDQLLFPDTLPPIDEMLFPNRTPNLDQLLPPRASPFGGDSFLDLERHSQVPIAAPPAVAREDAPASADPVTAAGDAVGIPSLILIRSPALAPPGIANGDVRRFAPISQPVPANEWQEGATPLTSAEGTAPSENLRPYCIALGMIPCLVAFGYTPSSLREQVHATQQAWKRLRRYLRRKP